MLPSFNSKGLGSHLRVQSPISDMKGWWGAHPQVTVWSQLDLTDADSNLNKQGVCVHGQQLYSVCGSTEQEGADDEELQETGCTPPVSQYGHNSFYPINVIRFCISLNMTYFKLHFVCPFDKKSSTIILLKVKCDSCYSVLPLCCWPFVNKGNKNWIFRNTALSCCTCTCCARHNTSGGPKLL